MNLLRAWYGELINPAKNEDKFYLLALFEDASASTKRYEVHTKWGRRGATGQELVAYDGNSASQADATYAKKQSEKQSKGYSPNTSIPVALQNYLNKVGPAQRPAPAAAAAPKTSQTPQPLVAPESTPDVSRFRAEIEKPNCIVQTRPGEGALIAIQVVVRNAARLLTDPAGGVTIAPTWANALKLDKLRGFTGVAPMIVEGMVITPAGTSTPRFVPLDVLMYGGDNVATYDFGTRWQLLLQGIDELRANGGAAALDLWQVPQIVPRSEIGNYIGAGTLHQLMLRDSSAVHGAARPLLLS